MAEPSELNSIIQEIVDARVDMQSFEEFMSVAKEVMISRRLAGDVHSMDHYLDYLDAIKLVFTQANGDVTVGDKTVKSLSQLMLDAALTLERTGGNIPYPTYAAMVANKASITNKMILEVLNDTDATKNGKYTYDGVSVFTKSAYDPLTQSKTYTESKVAEALSNINSKVTTSTAVNTDLSQFVDSNGSVYAKFDKDSQLLLSNMGSKSVQKSIKDLEVLVDGVGVGPKLDNLYVDTVDIDLHKWTDKNGGVTMRQAKDGKVYLPLMGSVSVQDALGSTISAGGASGKRLFSNEANAYISRLVASGMDFPSIPISQLPANYTVPDSLVDDIKFTVTDNRIVINTPYRNDDKTVHPHLIEFMHPIRGYRYILAINPYTTDQDENPCIYGSNDLRNFELLTGFDQPLEVAPPRGFQSDSGFTYDPINGELLVYWRSSAKPVDGSEYVTSYWMRRTKDLLFWEPKEEIFKNHDSVNDTMVSPAIVFNPIDGLWHCWNLQGNYANSLMRHRTCETLTGVWSDYEDIPIMNTTPWHMEVRWVGDKFVMLIFSRLIRNHYLGISSDGSNWTFGEQPVFANRVEGTYKSTFIPVINKTGGLYFEVLYTANELQLYHTTTNTLTI